MSAVAEQQTIAITEYSPLEAGLADLRHRFEKVVFDVTTTKGNTEARAARLELVRLRSALELKRVELKAPALERSRLIDTEANRIKKAILALEEPIDATIKAEEQRKEAERQAKIEAEQRRASQIQAMIDDLRIPSVMPGDSDGIAATIADLEAREIGDAYQGFAPKAQAIRDQTVASLKRMYADALAREQEAERLAAESARLAAERAKLDEERRAEEARVAEARRVEAERVAAERRIAREKAETEEAERKRLQKIEDDRLAAERRQAQAEHEARMKAEREAAEAERRRLAAIAEEQRRQAEAAAAEERARQEAAERARREEAAALAARAREIELDQMDATDDAIALVREIAEADCSEWRSRARTIVARLDVEIPA